MSLLLFELITSLFLGASFDRIADRNILTFQTGNVAVIMAIDSPRLVQNGLLVDGNRTIRSFTGVYRTIHYRLFPHSVPLPNNLRVKETIDVVSQSHYPEFDFTEEHERSVPVGAEGAFSDLLALGTTDGAVFPPDFRQLVQQRLYLINDNEYKSGRLLAVVAIERRRDNILIRLIWPSVKPFDSLQWSK